MPPPIASTEAIALYLNERLDGLLERPRMWAFSRESVEMQFLQLYEALAFVLRPDLNATTVAGFRYEYLANLRSGRSFGLLLHHLIPDDDEQFSKLAEKLRGLRAHLDQQLATAPVVEATPALPPAPSA